MSGRSHDRQRAIPVAANGQNDMSASGQDPVAAVSGTGLVYDVDLVLASARSQFRCWPGVRPHYWSPLTEERATKRMPRASGFRRVRANRLGDTTADRNSCKRSLARTVRLVIKDSPARADGTSVEERRGRVIAVFGVLLGLATASVAGFGSGPEANAAASSGGGSARPSVAVSKATYASPLAEREGVRATPVLERVIALGVNLDGGVTAAGLDAYTRLVGRTPAEVMWFQSWSEPLYYSQQRQTLLRRGVTPVVTWMPETRGGGVPLGDIVAGRWDAYLRSSAALAKAFHAVMFIRFAHEMNLSTTQYGPGHSGNTPVLFIAAWRHVVDVFRIAGVRNVRWVWSPNVDCLGRCPFANYYPGDSYVDWVALDGYNGPGSIRLPWRSFRTIFAASYAELTALTSRPIMIAEVASSETGGDKAAWIRSGLLTDVATSFPRVRALIWFDRLKEADWRVNSSLAALAAWRDVVGSPLYSGPMRLT